MAKLDKANIIKIVTAAAIEYEKKLNNRHFLIIYQKDGKFQSACVEFKSHNFRHLAGLTTEVRSNKFYSMCLNGKLAPRDFEIDSKGKAAQKLAVIPYLSDLMYRPCTIGDYIGSGIRLDADYIIGDTNATLSLCIRYSESNLDFPVSLLKEDVRKIIRPRCRVMAIFSRKYNEEHFSECTFMADGINISNLKIPAEYIVDVQ